MKCHYCERDAAFAPESDDVRVGLCPEHLQEKMEEMGAETAEELQEALGQA